MLPSRKVSLGDRRFLQIATIAFLVVIFLFIAIVTLIAKNAFESSFGLTLWQNGTLLVNTILTSLLATGIALLTGVSLAILITQYAQSWLTRPMRFIVDSMLVIPSVIYGLWGITVMQTLSIQPNLIAYSFVVSLMLSPTIVAIVRKVMENVPIEWQHGALAIGATKEEMIRLVILPYARRGIIGSAFVALTRAMGETIVVIMVIGHSVLAQTAIAHHSVTITFAILMTMLHEGQVSFNAPYQLGFILMVITIATSLFGRFLVTRTGKMAKEVR
nr:ABC transporter permease subunit [Bacilli bacterium]